MGKEGEQWVLRRHRRRRLLSRQRPARVKITEIFLSIQGEADSVGWPTVFVRLTGCPLRCQYCDTQYAFYGGEWLSLDDVLGKVAEFQTRTCA
jgi:7-carboxy-7-deazaguanine synthase